MPITTFYLFIEQAIYLPTRHLKTRARARSNLNTVSVHLSMYPRSHIGDPMLDHCWGQTKLRTLANTRTLIRSLSPDMPASEWLALCYSKLRNLVFQVDTNPSIPSPRNTLPILFLGVPSARGQRNHKFTENLSLQLSSSTEFWSR